MGKAFADLLLDGKPYQFKKDPNARLGWEIPREGLLSFTLLLPFRPAKEALQEGSWRESPYRRHELPVLSDPLFARFLRSFSLCEDAPAQNALIRGLVREFSPRASQARRLYELSLNPGVVIAELLDRIQDPEHAADLLRALQHSKDGGLPVSGPELPPARYLLDRFCGGNPSDRYRLDLQDPPSRMLAEQLLLLSAWEAENAKALERPDISQCGNYQCFRNERLDATPFLYGPDWDLPERGVLELDYAQMRRPPKTAKVLENRVFDDFLERIQAERPGKKKKDWLPLDAVVTAVRRASFGFFLTAAQARALVCWVQEKAAEERHARGSIISSSSSSAASASSLPSLPSGSASRTVGVQMLIAIFFRVRDYEALDQELFLPRNTDEGETPSVFSAEDLSVLEGRLGRLHLSTHLGMEKRPRLGFDLAVHEDRQLLRMVLAVAAKEGGTEAFKPTGVTFANPRYGPGPSGLVPMQTVPPPWATNVPFSGFFDVGMTGEVPKLELGCRKETWRRMVGWDLL